MLRVWKASGEQLAAIPTEELLNVQSLKKHLHGLCGLPRFRQRLLHNNTLEDDMFLASLPSPPDLQLVLLPFADASAEQAKELIASAESGSVPQLEMMLQRPQDPDAKGNWNSSALGEAAHGGHLCAVELLLEALADINCRFGRNNHTPLCAATLKGHAHVVRLLLEFLADADKGSDDRKACTSETPLAAASRLGDIGIVKLLLTAGADKDRTGPLQVASSLGRLQIVRLLLEARADVEQNRNHLTPLVTASRQGHVEVARLLLQARADKDRTDASFATPLGAATDRGRTEIVSMLLQAGASVDLAFYHHIPPNSFDLTWPLLTAARSGNAEIVYLLLNARADSEKRVDGVDGRTPLGEASSQGHTEVVQLLLLPDDQPLPPMFQPNTYLSWLSCPCYQTCLKSEDWETSECYVS